MLLRLRRRFRPIGLLISGNKRFIFCIIRIRIRGSMISWLLGIKRFLFLMKVLERFDIKNDWILDLLVWRSIIMRKEVRFTQGIEGTRRLLLLGMLIRLDSVSYWEVSVIMWWFTKTCSLFGQQKLLRLQSSSISHRSISKKAWLWPCQIQGSYSFLILEQVLQVNQSFLCQNKKWTINKWIENIKNFLQRSCLMKMMKRKNQQIN